MALRSTMPRVLAAAAMERPQRSRELDGLRALAVTGVVVYHALFQLPVLWRFGYPLGLHLDVGVVVFFVLSGYLIYKPFAETNCAGGEPPALGHYLSRRGARIYPAYVAALGGLALLGWVRLDGPVETIQHLTLTQGYFSPSGRNQLLDPPGISQAWTLVIEVSFYLFVPLWAAAMRRAPGVDRVRVEMLGAAALMVAGALAMSWHAYRGLPAFLAVLPPHLPGLGWGMLLAVVVAGRRLGPSAAAGPGRRPPVAELCWLGAAAALALLSYLVDEFAQTPRERLTDHALSLVIAALLVTPVVLSAPSPGLVNRFLCWRPMVALGVVSYGVYLWHGDLLFHLPGPWPASPILPAVAGMAAKIAVSLAAGALSYHLLERRALYWASRQRAPVSD